VWRLKLKYKLKRYILDSNNLAESQYKVHKSFLKKKCEPNKYIAGL